jgi:DNA polymerase eta
MDELLQSSQDGVPKSKFTYRHLNALSSLTPPKENPLRYIPDVDLSRCVVLIDLDCFYAQVEQVRLGLPKDEPLAVAFLVGR